MEGSEKTRVPLTEPLKVELSLEADVKYENKPFLCSALNQHIIHKECDSISCFLQKAKKLIHSHNEQDVPTYRESSDTDIQYTAGEHPLHLKVITICVCINTRIKHVVS